MIRYEIIEDCSPFYIRYRFDGIENFCSIVNKYSALNKSKNYSMYDHPSFRHITLENHQAEHVINLTPFGQQMSFSKSRVALLVTEPGFYYGAHKDGNSCRFSLNFGLSILDDKCVTSWYSDEDLKDYKISNDYFPSLGFAFPGKTAREILGWDKSKHKPIKTMIAKPNEGVLFNTDIWHDWDNSASSNRRIVLNMRLENPSSTYFEDARKILFGY